MEHAERTHNANLLCDRRIELACMEWSSTAFGQKVQKHIAMSECHDDAWTVNLDLLRMQNIAI